MNEYKRISAKEARDMMNDSTAILDVRSNEEYDQGHIHNAILLPDYELTEKVETILKDRNQTILVYCRTGRRSASVARRLIEMGYSSVYDFGGLLTDWPYEIEK